MLIFFLVSHVSFTTLHITPNNMSSTVSNFLHVFPLSKKLYPLVWQQRIVQGVECRGTPKDNWFREQSTALNRAHNTK